MTGRESGMGKTPYILRNVFQLIVRIMTGTETLQAGEPVSAPARFEASPPRRILVVEDEPDIRRINAIVLHRAGYHVDTAEDGHAGWKAVSHAPESYALLITDHNMPGLTGLALVKKVRDARMTLPVIMATGALPEVDLFDRYPWLQPAVALLKPYSIEQLLGTVEKVLRATVIPDEEFAPPSNWQGRPIPNGLQL
jgi:two-component system phosphate regulon response regulator OmpR